MTLKKRMFRSNMKILFSALLALMAVFLLVLVIFEDSFEKEFHRISQTELDSHVEEVVRIIEDDRMQTAGDLKEKVEGWGYRTAVIAGDRILSGDRDGQMGDLAELFCGKEETGGQPEIFVYQKATVVSKYLPGENAYLTAAHFPEENWLSASLRQSFAVFLLVILLIGLGADDYITKPFDPSQLVARVRAHLKRYARLTAKRAGEDGETDQIVVQDVVIEPRTWKVWKKGKELKLPNREFELLRFLAENPNIVFSKEKLFEKIWGYDYISDAATVSVHINRLREKIEDDARNPKIIETVWGAGYRMNM